MRINFLVNEVTGGWEPTDTRLGGTEESVVRWAEELAKRGHQVLVFHNGNKKARYKNTDVVWIDRNSFFYDDGNADVYINVKSHDFRGDDRFMAGKLMPQRPVLYLTNETNASDLDLSTYDGVIWPSQWAEENIPVNNSRRFILPHGYDSSKIYPSKKIPKQCLYASSPDRGLETLLRVWPKVHAAHPDATLKVTYGATEFDFPGIEFLGEVDEETMNQLYRESDIWTHPCNGGELYGITGIKAQAAGCVPVIIPTMALKETVRHGYFTDEAHYAETLIKALDEPEKRSEIRKVLSGERYPDWQDSTDQLLKIIREVLH